MTLYQSFIANAPALRRNIESGMYPRFSYPVKNKRMHGGRRSTVSDEKKRITVIAVNNLRNYGLTALAAANEVGIAYQTYAHWSDKLGIAPPPRKVKP